MLPSGLKILKSSPAEDKDTLTVTSDTASQYKLKTIDDLKPVAGKLIVGAGPEFKTRYQGLVGLEKVYGLTFKSFKALDPGGPLTKAALKKDQIQVANIFSTDSTIADRQPGRARRHEEPVPRAEHHAGAGRVQGQG